MSGTTRSHSVMATASEIKKIIDDALNPIKSDIAKLLKLEKKINAQEKLIKSLEKRVELVESLEKRVEALEPLQERVDILESQLKVLESLDRRIDEVEQYGRRMCLRFNNIEVSQDGSKEDCVKIISDIMKETKCGVGKRAIDRAHRIGPRKSSKDGITTPWGGVLYIFWVRGRAIGRGIDFHDFGIRNGIYFYDFGIRNGIDFHDFGIRNGINFRNFHNLYSVGYAFSENWYKVGYTFRKNWYKERVCF